MNYEETLTGLIEKYRRNREAVPIGVLKTKYAVAYNKLCDSIKDGLKYIALQFPPWITGRQIRVEYAGEIIELFNRLYAEGGYSKKLGRAAFKDMNPAEAIRIANEIAANFGAELENYVSTKSCLYATQPCWKVKEPEKPKIYNDLLGLFYDDATGSWREPEPGEMQPAVLIFIDKGKQENE